MHFVLYCFAVPAGGSVFVIRSLSVPPADDPRRPNNHHKVIPAKTISMALI